MKLSLRKPLIARTLLLTLMLVFAAHAFCFFNLTYSGQSVMLNAAKGSASQTSGGQFLLPFYWRVRGAVSAPLLVGALSALYLAATLALTSGLLGLQSRALLFALCGALSVNAGVTSIFAASLHTADAAFLAQLLGTAGVCLCMRSRPGILPAAALLAAAQALHADALSVAAALALIVLIRRLAAGEGGRSTLVCGIRATLAFALGAALYAAGYAVLLRLRGLDAEAQLHLPASAPDAWLAPVRALLSPLTAYAALNVVLRIALALLAVLVLARAARRLGALRSAAIAALLLAVPLAANLPVFARTGTAQFRLSYAYLDVLLLSLLSLADGAGEPARRLRLGAAGAMAVLFLGSIVFSNQVYLKKNLEFTSTLSVMTRVIDRAEHTEGYRPGYTPVAIIGTPEDSALSVPHKGFEHLAALDAASANCAVASSEDMIWYVWEVLGYPFNFVSTYEQSLLSGRDEVRDMPAFPAEGCCRMIDGTLVIRLSP